MQTVNEGNNHAEQVRTENAAVKQSAVISIERHQEVLGVYTAVAREAVKLCGITIPPGCKHSGLVHLLVNEIHRLRGQIAVSSAVVLGPTMEVFDDGRIPPHAGSSADSSGY